MCIVAITDKKWEKLLFAVVLFVSVGLYVDTLEMKTSASCFCWSDKDRRTNLFLKVKNNPDCPAKLSQVQIEEHNP